LGWIGKNTNLINKKKGSFFFLAELILDLELDYDIIPTKDHCGTCTRCIDACPTGALSEPFAMDRGACIAHLSFFSSDLPSDDLKDQMGSWLYGCDVCQDVCPKNRNAWTGEREFPGLDSIVDILSPEKILEMDEETFLKRLQPRFWYIGKDGVWLWKCNAIRAMANSLDEKYHTLIKGACDESHENVRSMAKWACRKAGI